MPFVYKKAVQRNEHHDFKEENIMLQLGRVTEVLEQVPPANAGFVTQCRCGRLWNVTMERGTSGIPGCVRCECHAELVSWSGTVIFSAIPANPD